MTRFQVVISVLNLLLLVGIILLVRLPLAAVIGSTISLIITLVIPLSIIIIGLHYLYKHYKDKKFALSAINKVLLWIPMVNLILTLCFVLILLV